MSVKDTARKPETPDSPDLDSLAGQVPERLTRRGLGIMRVGIGREPWVFFLATVFSIIFGVMTVADAWVLGWATDNVIVPSISDGNYATGTVVAGIALFMTVALLRMIGVIGRRIAGGIVFFRLMRRDRRAVTRKYLDLPLSWHRNHPAGQLLSNANSDVEATWSVFNPLAMAIGTIAMMLAAIFSMVITDPLLAVVGLVVFPLLFAINIVYQRWQGPRLALAQSLRGSVSSIAHESIDGALVVKSLGREAEETSRFAARSEQLRDANIGVGRVRAIFDPVLEALPNIGVLLVIAVGVTRVNAGAIAPGDVVQIAFLFTVVALPMRSIGWVLGEIPRSVVGADRVATVLQTDESMQYGTRELAGTGPVAVSVNAVGFQYDDADRPTLQQVDFQIGAGRVVAVVGATGSGKSTLISLLNRQMDPTSGQILLAGMDIRELSHRDLAQSVALVPQSTFLFDDSVRENIALGADLSDDDIWQVLSIVQADRFVRALPSGLDTELGERGASLSGGQRQRLALARALVRRPRLLILDDATSALDPAVEQRILSSLKSADPAGSSQTVIVVAYRKATIGLADEVVHLDRGRVVGRGTDAELRADSARYRNLVDAYDQAREKADRE